MEFGAITQGLVFEGVNGVAPLLHQINEGIPVSADEVMLFHEDLQRLERKSVRTESLLLFVIERICLLEHVQVGFVVHVKHRQEEF